jgi:hypothetical protein
MSAMSVPRALQPPAQLSIYRPTAELRAHRSRFTAVNHARPCLHRTRELVNAISHRSLLHTDSLPPPSHLPPSNPGGIVLYSHSFNPNYANIDRSAASPVAALFESVLVDGKRREEEDTFEKGGFSVRWLRENELGLVFVVS